MNHNTVLALNGRSSWGSTDLLDADNEQMRINGPLACFAYTGMLGTAGIVSIRQPLERATVLMCGAATFLGKEGVISPLDDDCIHCDDVFQTLA
jgi:hypothetical protein